MISPEDIEKIDKEEIDKLINQIDKSIIANHGAFDFELATVDKTLPLGLKIAVGQKYKEVGWPYVYHRAISTGSGSTQFIFSLCELKKTPANGFQEV